MQKNLAIFFVIPTYIYAVYNPFFSETPTSHVQGKLQENIPKTPTTKRYIPSQKTFRKSIEMTYFGFIESNRGSYALVAFDNKNIIIQVRDFLYLDEQIYKIKKINSNYILLTDKIGRDETVYFSSQDQSQ